MSNLVVNPTEFGIEDAKANELIGNLPQIKSERDVLEQSFDQVIKMDIESPESSKAARELRLKIRDNRTKGIEVWHKTTKDFFLKGGQFVDAIKKKEIAVNQRMESALEEIEKYAENKEKERIEALRVERKEKVNPFIEFVPPVDLGTLSDEDFDKLFTGAKMQSDAKVEAEKKAEEERIAKEKAEAEERERIRIENEKLKAEAEERERQLAKERAKSEAERKALEAKAKAEAEERERLEAELKAKKEAEEKAELEKLAELKRQKEEAEKLAKAPIKKQMTNWVISLTAGNPPELNDTAKDIINKFEDFRDWALNRIKQM